MKKFISLFLLLPVLFYAQAGKYDFTIDTGEYVNNSDNIFYIIGGILLLSLFGGWDLFKTVFKFFLYFFLILGIAAGYMYILSKLGIILQVILHGDTQKNNSIGIVGLLVFIVGWFGPILIYAKKTKQNINLSSISEGIEQIKINKNKEIIKYATYLAIIIGFIALLVTLLKEPNKIQEVNINNYDDCLSDMVKNSKKSNDYEVVKNVCRNKFPRLKELSLKKDANLSCKDSDEKSVYHILVKDSVVTIRENNNSFQTTSFSREGIMFMTSFQNKDKKQLKIYGKVNSISGEGTIIVEYADKKNADYVYEFNCVEE